MTFRFGERIELFIARGTFRQHKKLFHKTPKKEILHSDKKKGKVKGRKKILKTISLRNCSTNQENYKQKTTSETNQIVFFFETSKESITKLAARNKSFESNKNKLNNHNMSREIHARHLTVAYKVRNAEMNKEKF